MLILGDMSELATDAVKKNLIISEVLLEKVLKLRLRPLVLGFEATFMLVLLLDH